jgi:hypothetical protein
MIYYSTELIVLEIRRSSSLVQQNLQNGFGALNRDSGSCQLVLSGTFWNRHH